MAMCTWVVWSWAATSGVACDHEPLPGRVVEAGGAGLLKRDLVVATGVVVRAAGTPGPALWDAGGILVVQYRPSAAETDGPISGIRRL